MSEVLDDGTIITQLTAWDPRTPHTEQIRWYFGLADGSEIEFIGRVHTEIGTRGYGLQTAAQLVDPDWTHHERGWCDGIQGTAVGQTVSMRVIPTENLYNLGRRLWVAPAPTVAIRQHDWSQIPPRTTSDWWYCELEDGTSWIEESFPGPPGEGAWDFTQPMGRYWRLNLYPRLPRTFYLSSIKQVGEDLGYVRRPLTSADCPETMPMEQVLGRIIHSFPVQDPATWKASQ